MLRKSLVVVVTTLHCVNAYGLVYRQENGHFYSAVSEPDGITWSAASEAAELAGGHLATITSESENEFVYNLIDDDKFWHGKVGPWLGGYQIENTTDPLEGWQWVTGEAFDYSNWAVGEPAGFRDRDNQARLHYYFKDQRTSTWDDTVDNPSSFNAVFGYVIEYPDLAINDGVLAYFNDFEGGADHRWSHTQTDVTPVGERRFLGQFGNDMVTLTLDNLPEHSSVRLSFDLFIIRSWDGNHERYGPDVFSIDAGHGANLMTTTFDNHHFQGYEEHLQAFPGEHLSWTTSPMSEAYEIGTLGYTFDFPQVGVQVANSVYEMGFTFSHISGDLTVNFSTTFNTWTGMYDESWGIDNVTVEILREPITRSVTFSSSYPDAILMPGAGSASYHDGDVFTIAAAPPSEDQVFMGWQGSAVARGLVADPNALNTTVTMGGTFSTYTLRAVYDETLLRTLTIGSNAGGSVITPGEGVFQFVDGQVVTIEAVLVGTDYRFDRWTGTATTTERGMVADPLARRTTVSVYGDCTLEAVFVERDDGPALGITLGEIQIDEPVEYYRRVETNNTPGKTLVQQVTGIGPDPNGMIQMQVVEENSARAKGTFGASTAQKILVQFDYLFESLDDIEFVVYLSDVPELMDHDARTRKQHYIEIGRVPTPPAGRPGSAGSARFGTFEAWVSTDGLDLSNGTWVELELISTSGGAQMQSVRDGGLRLASTTNGGDGSAYVDNWAVAVHCDGICMDLNWSTTVDEEDFLLVVAACGREAGLIDDGQDSLKCLDGIFSNDGYVDSHDIHPWSWALSDEARKNLCPELPLRDVASVWTGHTLSMSRQVPEFGRTLASVAELPGELMVMGKRRMSGQYTFSDLLGDCLCLFEDDLTFVVDYAEAGVPRQGNIRATTGPGQSLYLINSELGILKIDDNVTSIVPAGTVTLASEPRYRSSATIQIGIQEAGETASGRPILDAAFDAAGDVYVVPAIVQPEGQDAYEAAARLRLQIGANPPYEVVQLYDDPPLPHDNQYRDSLREIEVDGAGNVYLVNAHALNESCIVWKYALAGTLLNRLDLLGPNSLAKIADPLAMHVSQDGQTLYLASGQCNLQDPTNSTIHKLSTSDFSSLGTVTIQNMRQITAITEEPAKGTLWIAGVNMPEIPAIPSIADEPFYIAALAQLAAGADTARAVDITDPAQHNLALPTSIIWIGDQE